MLTGVRYDPHRSTSRGVNPPSRRNRTYRSRPAEAVVIILGLVFLVTWVVILTQAYAVSRVEIEYGVLKTRLEKLEEELRNGR